MYRKIYRSMRLLSALTLTIAVIFMLSAGYTLMNGRLQEEIRRQTDLIAAGTETAADAAAYLAGLGETLDEKRVTLIADDGTVRFDNNYSAIALDNHNDRPEVIAARKEGEGTAERYSMTLGASVYYCARQLSDGSVLRVASATGSLSAIALGMLAPLLILLILTYIISTVIAVRLTQNITRPINAYNLSEDDADAVYEELRPFVSRIAGQNAEIKRQMQKIDAQKKQLEVLLGEKERTEQIRKEFSANVSHELKTPLTSILGYAQIINSGMAKEADVPVFTQKIEQETTRMIALVQDIIELSRLDELSEPIATEQLDLAALCHTAAEALRPEAEARNITLCVEGDAAFVEGNAPQIRELIFNLCDNAIKYSPDGGRVVLRTYDRSVAVEDHGIGIPAEYHDRIFERFFRVDKSHSRRVNGTGLGLSIVKHIVLCHKATIHVDSEPGRGTTMTVTFP